MTTVAILPVSDASGERLYRAITGDKQSTGKTAGEALDALTAQLGSSSTVASDRKTTQTDNNIQENFPGCRLSRT